MKRKFFYSLTISIQFNLIFVLIEILEIRHHHKVIIVDTRQVLILLNQASRQLDPLMALNKRHPHQIHSNLQFHLHRFLKIQ